MEQADEAALAAIAENGRSEIPEEFFRHRRHVAACLEARMWPEPLVTRKATGSSGPWSRVAYAALAELRLLLCTQNKKYEDVRVKAGSFTKVALPAVSGYVAGTLDISLGVATACVAFVALCVFRLGAGVFCSMTEPRAAAR